jgi:hypothetical protein
MREIGCDAGQGYLFQRPVPAEAFEDFLRTWPQRKLEFGFTRGYYMPEREPICAIAEAASRTVQPVACL